MQQKKLPIGYYLKLADNYLTKGIDEIQAQHSLNRIEWQILHSIFEESSMTKQKIFEMMKPHADSQVVEKVLSKFSSKNFIETTNDTFTLTTAGQDMHKACFDTQKKFREKAVSGISEIDYQTTISTLQKIINNIQ